MDVARLILAGAHWPGRLIACAGAALGIMLTIVVCTSVPTAFADLPIIVAPLSASAVLVFAVPASPLAQPWSVVGGNVVSALVGVAAYQLVPDNTIAAGIAVGGAILAMSLLRCLHPPGGAAALTAVIGSQSIHTAGFAFAFVPVAVNSLALVALGVVFHRITRRSYPHRSVAPSIDNADIGLHLADIDQALDDMHETYDISREDLSALLSRAELHALSRRNSRR